MPIVRHSTIPSSRSAGTRGPRPCHSAARPSRVAGVGGAADAANAPRPTRRRSGESGSGSWR